MTENQLTAEQILESYSDQVREVVIESLKQSSISSITADDAIQIIRSVVK